MKNYNEIEIRLLREGEKVRSVSAHPEYFEQAGEFHSDGNRAALAAMLEMAEGELEGGPKNYDKLQVLVLRDGEEVGEKSIWRQSFEQAGQFHIGGSKAMLAALLHMAERDVEKGENEAKVATEETQTQTQTEQPGPKPVIVVYFDVSPWDTEEKRISAKNRLNKSVDNSKLAEDYHVITVPRLGLGTQVELLAPQSDGCNYCRCEDAQTTAPAPDDWHLSTPESRDGEWTYFPEDEEQEGGDEPDWKVLEMRLVNDRARVVAETSTTREEAESRTGVGAEVMRMLRKLADQLGAGRL